MFGEGFLQDHAGHIISEPHIALVESRQRVRRRCHAGGCGLAFGLNANFSVSDNGSGMTRAEFEKRWKTLCYNRLNEQGASVKSPNKGVTNRRAFGRSGKGRHGGFCFADAYDVERSKDGESSECASSEQTAAHRRSAALLLAR